MTDDGYVKFSCHWISDDPLGEEQVQALSSCREKLKKMGLIGAHDDGIGFGNISRRWREDQFVISGTQTGHLDHLTARHYSLVVDFDIHNNHLVCKGPSKASSESMSHGVIYQQNEGINAVIHVHSTSLWEKLLFKVPTTGKSMAYGTPAMAMEIVRLFQETDVYEQKVIAMAGHQDGLFSFGMDLDEAMRVMLAFL
jgi:L-ribulose-5-phosphate 4-epimerase